MSSNLKVFTAAMALPAFFGAIWWILHVGAYNLIVPLFAVPVLVVLVAASKNLPAGDRAAIEQRMYAGSWSHPDNLRKITRHNGIG